MNIIWLILAHFIGDIGLQNSWQAENKGRLWYVMLSHCMIWAAMISIALEHIGIFSIGKVIFLVLGHFLIDTWKSQIPRTLENWKYIYPDQGLHLVQLIVVYAWGYIG